MNASSSLPMERPVRHPARREERPVLVDRDKDLRQLARLMGLAKSGQPKSVLVCGDAGIGKTALLGAFCEAARRRSFCRVLDLRAWQAESVEQFYIACIEALQAEAHAIFDEALAAVNELLEPLALHWQRQDLARAVALVKLQESISGKQALTQDSLIKAIRSAVASPAKKVRGAALSEVIEQLVNVIVNPWLLVAVNLTNPLVPSLRDAIDMAERLRAGESVVAAQKAIQRASGARSPSGEALDSHGDAHWDHHLDQLQGSALPHRAAIDLLASSPPQAIGDDAPIARTFALPAAPSVPSPDASEQTSPLGDTLAIDALVRHLMNALLFVNQAIESLDSALVLVVDSWEQTLALPETRRQDLKDFLASLLREMLETPNGHWLLTLACRSEGQSESLGGPLYSLFRNKLLLAGLQERPRRTLFLSPFREHGVDVDEPALNAVFRLAQGNPLWLLKLRHVVLERALANGVAMVDMPFFRKLGLECLEDVLESALTRLELAFLNQQDDLYKVIAGMLRQWGDSPFEPPAVIADLSVSQGVSELFVADVLRQLYVHDFVTLLPARPAPADSLPEPPQYVFQSRQVRAFLEAKTQQVTIEVPASEKIAYLRKIIPLSVRSGELDREKTREVLQLCAAMGDTSIIDYLQETFLSFVHDDNALARLSALNNLAVLESPPAVRAVIDAMTDSDAVVREYAVRNLALMARKPWDAPTREAMATALIGAIDDESEAVRSQAYLTLSRHAWHGDVTAVFIKGMADACDAVRLTSITTLSGVQSDAPLLRATFLDAARDRLSAVRRHAITGLQRFDGNDIMACLVSLLREDPDTALRAAVADALSSMDTPMARDALLTALEGDPDEDVKITIVRALGRHRGWENESRLLQLLHADNADQTPMEQAAPGLLWACIRALGHIAVTPQSLQTLHGIRARVRNEIIRLAAEVAIRRMTDRVDDLRQLEHQLHSATPIAVADPTPPPDPDADLPVIEDESA